MFKGYKFSISVTVLLILSSAISTIFTIIIFIVLALVYFDFDWDNSIEEHGANKVRNLYLNVRKLRSSKTTQHLYCHNRLLYTPTMSNLDWCNDSSKLNKSSFMLSPIANSNGVNNLRQRTTSTPLSSPVSIFHHNQGSLQTSPHNKLYNMTSRKYSLSDVQAPVNKTYSSPVQTVAGPLLASTRFNENLSTYTNTKSPGLAQRIVNYSNGNHDQWATHQSKYGTTGLFPIVRLFKQDVPVIALKPKKVTVRIAPPDLHNPEHNKIILESMIQQQHINTAKVDSTRSVLDALKEISRKRIHTTEDFDIEQENSKRQRKDCLNEYRKRLREESPCPSDSPTSSSVSSKRPRVVDAVTASMASYKRFEELQRRIKRKSEDVISDEKKLANAETQTNEPNTTSKLEKKKKKRKDKMQEDAETSVERTTLETTDAPQKFAPCATFDPSPLEITKKNKLAVMLGAITGEEPKLLPYNRSYLKESRATKDNSTQYEVPLVSILSPPNKVKHNKHVHFNLPEKIATVSVADPDNTLTVATNTPTDSCVETTANVLTPSMDSAKQDTSSCIEVTPNRLPSLSSSLNQDTPLTTVTPTTSFNNNNSLPKNGLPVIEMTLTNSNDNKILLPTTNISFTSPHSVPQNVNAFQFGAQNTNTSGFATTSVSSGITNLVDVTPQKTSPPKVGGFKFDLKKSESAMTTVTETPKSVVDSVDPKSIFNKSALNVNTANSATAQPLPLPPLMGSSNPASSLSFMPSNVFGPGTGNIASANAVSTNSNPFESKSTTANSFATNMNSFGANSFGTTTTNCVSVKPAVSDSFGVASNAATFGKSSTQPNPLASANNETSQFGSANNLNAFVSPANNSGLFDQSNKFASFGANVNVGKASPLDVAAGAPGTFNLGTNTFGATSNTFGPTTTASSFGTPTTNASSFGTPTTNAFSSLPSSNSFGSNPAFGSNSVPNMQNATPVNLFNNNNNTSSVFGSTTVSQPFGGPASMFGSGNPATAHGTPTTKTAINSTPAPALPFGNTNNAFSTNATPNINFGSSPAPSFGTAPPTTVPTTAPPGFGFNISQPSVFGGNSAQTAPAAFGANPSTPAFRSSVAPNPGQNNTPNFGSASSNFNLNVASAFPSVSSSLGSNMNAPPLSNNSSFGNTVATSGSQFGQPSFGNQQFAPTFGAGESTFGKPQGINTFGTSGNQAVSTFGDTKNNSFNSGASAIFGSPSTTQTGAAFTSFGSNANVPTTQPFTFGASNTATSTNAPTGGFSFAPSEPAKGATGGFNFSSAAKPAPAFGATAAPNFNANNTTFAPPNAGFNNANVPQFNPPSANMFNIGSGATPKTRTALKARRRM